MRFSPFTLCITFSLVYHVSAVTEIDCRVPADPDTLGLGVRLGLYFQISSVLLLQLVRVDEALDSFLATALFFISFLFAVIYSAAKDEFPPGSVIACTWYPLLMWIALGPQDFRSYSGNRRKPRLVMLMILLVAASSLNVWFWFKGLDAYHPDQCMAPRVFFFTNLSAYGNTRFSRY
jgi:hypothetical protein